MTPDQVLKPIILLFVLCVVMLAIRGSRRATR